MSTPDSAVAQRIAESAQPVVDSIYDGIQEAHYNVRHLTKKGKRMEALQQPHHIKLVTDLYRFFIFNHLDANEADLGDWRLNRQIQKNSITVHNGLQTIKLFHTTKHDVIPAAGRNTQRVNYFSSEIGAADPDALLAAQNLILTWQRWKPTAPLRLVHTLTTGTYSTNPKIDFSCVMQRSSEDFSGYSFDRRELDQLEDYGDLEIATGTDS
ncbi:MULTISPECIES: hypothetical protein [unclassified Curtobacterium]|uniref:hypothetical protein n=1 Tax=unclassified Curtobacterium TaxID=257496 RepID=UPI00188C674A|nr:MULTISPECIES: hypothetical protein [unclassified Curtobacterium]MBF4591734.1 hypothetical protein [Curtobacterium sp. VKM Ac-1395]MCY1692941.1 hypothetical protein [Curtobacterium sp. SL109]